MPSPHILPKAAPDLGIYDNCNKVEFVFDLKIDDLNLPILNTGIKIPEGTGIVEVMIEKKNCK